MIQEKFGCTSLMGGSAELPLCPGLERLKSEHGPLRKQMDHFFHTANSIDFTKEAGELLQPLAELREEILSFTRELDPHSEREEQVLFPMMVKYIGREMGPIAVMEYEHEMAKEHLKRFLEETESPLASWTADDIRQKVGYAQQAYTILSDHFLKEERILFPMAERLLHPEEKEELLRRIGEI
jgi:regulator of cell morphogenesis and NO signaling